MIRYLKYIFWWFDIHIHCERVPATLLINMSITSHIYLVGEYTVSSTLSKFQLYSTLLSTLVTMFTLDP